ncbi:MAG: shikimate dehydrogenase [Candidatus Caldarchaeum sp.]|nr:shikimate dehydrogenase [Candidatus Caldarchaeum sp.]MDW7978291.1 shikimate dehydrogenase [Candidatus Caldarchaeum sp.]
MRTGLLGVVGYPVGHSVSPQMVNAALRHAGVDNVLYISVEVKPRDLQAFCRSARLLNFIGFNVTIPHKVSVIKYLSRLDSSAKQVGAVNVVKVVGEKLVGFNTDVHGVMHSVPSKRDVDGGVVVLGVGGAARAAAVALKRKGFAEIVFAYRRMKTAREFKRFAESRRIGCRLVRMGSDEMAEEMRRCGLLINATPVGMHPHTRASPIASNLIHRRMTVFDMVYNPPETKLLKAAKARGAETINGVNMLVAQGAEALKIWLRLEADRKVMEKAVVDALKMFSRRRTIT